MVPSDEDSSENVLTTNLEWKFNTVKGLLLPTHAHTHTDTHTGSNRGFNVGFDMGTVRVRIRTPNPSVTG